MVTIEDLLKAKHRIDPYIHQTPVLTSSLLNKWLGHEIYFKAECLQKVGAFKARGACNAIAWLKENHIPVKHIVANSSGNHAQAVSWAASQFGYPSTIYMPAYTSKVKVQATVAYGAKAVLCETRTMVDEQVKQAAEEKDTHWIHPFNHEHVIAGQGTATVEAINQLGEVDAVFAPCGGGGLLSGTLIATRALAPKAKMIGTEPLNANDAAQSIRMNSIQSLQGAPDTLADGAMTPAVGKLTFEYLKQLDDMYEIEEQHIIYWAQWLSHLLKVRVEPTSALAMEGARRWLSSQSGKKKVLIVLSGGNIDQNTELKIWKENCLDRLPELNR
ncbi:MAG: serine/threonine dehydratase [Saprospiraceae bacterium]